jgi:hypothetical protein
MEAHESMSIMFEGASNEVTEGPSTSAEKATGGEDMASYRVRAGRAWIVALGSDRPPELADGGMGEKLPEEDVEEPEERDEDEEERREVGGMEVVAGKSTTRSQSSVKLRNSDQSATGKVKSERERGRGNGRTGEVSSLLDGGR